MNLFRLGNKQQRGKAAPRKTDQIQIDPKLISKFINRTKSKASLANSDFDHFQI